ncbi:RHS repeat-associated core domain-containing protein [Kribbella turkmenica]|uniref:RHS repeat-associated core domain-containing protein n=1 Tax=Kribbella turkmenica TaxID=2530375 RepID=UPI00140468F7|nr:RHS repeat-associated core domain-containing protein [Kribbella turkmenica]
MRQQRFDTAGAPTFTRLQSFDPFDRVVSQAEKVGTAQSISTRYTFVGLADQVAVEEERDTAGVWKVSKSYAYGAGGENLSLVDSPVNGTTSSKSFYGTNPHGDVETLTDATTGLTTSTYRYTAYGQADRVGTTGDDAITGTPGQDADVVNPYRFNSKRFNGATGTYDMGFREYNPALNRFLSRDYYDGALKDLALGSDPWNTNRYAFAGGNPITGIELDGHYAILENGDRADLSAHDAAVVASVEPAEKWMAENDFDGEITIDVGKGGKLRNRVEGGAKDNSGAVGYADMIIWGKGKDEGVIFVYEIKPATEYGLTGPDQLNRYVTQLRKMHPGAIVNAGPSLDSADFVSREGNGRVWSGKRKRNDKESFDGMRWYGTNTPKTPTRVTSDTQGEPKVAQEERWWTQVPTPPDVSQEAGNIVGLIALGAFCAVTPACAASS